MTDAANSANEGSHQGMPVGIRRAVRALFQESLSPTICSAVQACTTGGEPCQLDRWPPETHSFHLSCGEMMVTLEDFTMITGLPLHGEPLTGGVCNKFWHERVNNIIGDCSPSLTARGKKDNRTSGVPFNWLRENGSGCLQGVDDETMEKYAQAYLWYLLSHVLFADYSGDIASWMYLDFPADWDRKYSWGSASLAYLYRQVTSYCNSFYGWMYVL